MILYVTGMGGWIPWWRQADMGLMDSESELPGTTCQPRCETRTGR